MNTLKVAIADILKSETWNNTTILLCIGLFFFFLLISTICILVVKKLANRKVTSLQDEIIKIQQENEGLSTKKNELELQITNLNENIIANSVRLEERSHEIKQLQEQKQELKISATALEQEFAKVSGQNGDLFARGQLFQQQIAGLKNDLKELKDETKDISIKYFDINNKYTALKTEHVEKQNSLTEQIQTLEQNKQHLAKEFQNLSNKIFEERNNMFLHTSKDSLSSLLMPFKQQLEQFQQRINEIHTVSVKSSSTLELELKKLSESNFKISDEAHNLTTALKGDKKLMGCWGEIQLERTLQAIGLIPEQHYKTQEKFYDENRNGYLPDVVIYLPDEKHLIIDSKVSLVAYDRAVASDKIEQENIWLDSHVKAIKNHIDDLNKKDYCNLPDITSPNFVLMFIPIEPAYLIALQHDNELFHYGYKKNVILVSHTTLLPILSTVSNLWRIASGNKEAQDIVKKAGEIYNQVCIISDRLIKLGNTLNTATKQYNDTVVGLSGQQGLYGKIEKFKGLSSYANKELVHPSEIKNIAEYEKLQQLNTND